MVIVRLLPANGDIFPFQCKDISDKVKESFFISLISDFRRKEFFRRVGGSLA